MADITDASQYEPVSSSPRTRMRQLDEFCSTFTLTGEIEWKAKQPFLATRGYMLRPRYREGWVPSWRGKDVSPRLCEDSITLQPPEHLIDATRISDSKPVQIKQVKTNDKESQIALMLGSGSSLSDPRNHCVPVLDIFQDSEDPAISYMVMPFLYHLDQQPFELIEEFAEFCDQLLEGLVFIHEQGVAHRDCSRMNLMMDATTLFPTPRHPVRQKLLPDGITEAPPAPLRLGKSIQYYYIDFGYSVLIPHDVHPKLVLGEHGRDQEPPELSETVPYDPFKLDVFIIGNVLRREYRDNYLNVGFLDPLIEAMTQHDPAARPDAKGAQRMWLDIRRGLWTPQRLWWLRPHEIPSGTLRPFFRNLVSIFRIILRGPSMSISSLFSGWFRKRSV